METIYTFPAPTVLTPSQPHIKNVFNRLVKRRGQYMVQHDIYETYGIYYKNVVEMVCIPSIHDWIYQNLLGINLNGFKTYWKSICRDRECVDYKVDDLVFDSKSNDLFFVDTNDKALQIKIHPLHKDRYPTIAAYRIDMKDSANKQEIIYYDELVYLQGMDLMRIGNTKNANVIKAIRQMVHYTNGRRTVLHMLHKRLKNTANLEGRVQFVNIRFDLMDYVVDDFIIPMLQYKHIPFHQQSQSKPLIIKLRTDSFIEQFNAQYIFAENANITAYLDYLKLFVYKHRNTVTLKCVFLKQDKVTGIIEGEDLIELVKFDE
eukprot:132229_1